MKKRSFFHANFLCDKEQRGEMGKMVHQTTCFKTDCFLKVFYGVSATLKNMHFTVQRTLHSSSHAAASVAAEEHMLQSRHKGTKAKLGLMAFPRMNLLKTFALHL